MNLEEEAKELIGLPENETLEYKAVLPPSRSLAQLICAFGNTIGGFIIIGISVNYDGKIDVLGLSQEFNATGIVHKAVDMINPKVQVEYQYILHNDKRVYVIKIYKSKDILSIADKIYKRENGSSVIQNPVNITFKLLNNLNINRTLFLFKGKATSSKVKLLEHYQGILKIIDDLNEMLYPNGIDFLTDIQEGKILLRIIFSSIVDNFETYLSDLLFEIFLSNPLTLKSKQTVTLEEVLSCSDLQEFVQYIAKQKLMKLQKGSVKGFIKENSQIKDLNIIDEIKQIEIENILQIRHLYAHRNGIIDEKFLQYFTGLYNINVEHRMTVNEVLEKLLYLSNVAHELDQAASKKYKLSTE